jgi:GNAT superfamily N-acetyltransferase
MQTEIQLREANPAEADAIAALVVQAYRDYQPGLSAENWQTMQSGLARSAGRIEHAAHIVAEIGDALAAYVAYFPPGHSSPTLYEAEWASFRLLAVAPTHRGRGLARLLSQACIERARKDGAGTIGLHTSEAMMTAHALYERMGFRKTRELPAMFGLRYWQFRLDL